MRGTRKTVLSSLMMAVAVASGYALSGIPNMELMTLVVFISGFLLGPRLGALVGAVAIAAHSVMNPLGAALPPLLASQIGGFALIGLAGGWTGPVIERTSPRWVAGLMAGASGLAVTLLYDVLSNVGAFYSITGDAAPESLVKFVAAGVAFTIMHVVWNTGVFLAVAAPALRALARYRRELSAE